MTPRSWPASSNVLDLGCNEHGTPSGIRVLVEPCRVFGQRGAAGSLLSPRQPTTPAWAYNSTPIPPYHVAPKVRSVENTVGLSETQPLGMG